MAQGRRCELAQTPQLALRESIAVKIPETVRPDVRNGHIIKVMRLLHDLQSLHAVML
jgi:hypothetical protein